MRRIRGRTLVLATLAAVAVGASAAVAAIPSSSGAVNGCYERITGILRVIDKDTGKNCKSFENPITWSVQGPRGEIGPAGPPGEAGPKGDDGAPGTPAPLYSAGSGLELVGTQFRLDFDPATQTELDAERAARVTLQQQVAALQVELAQLTSVISVVGGEVAITNRNLRVYGGTVRANAFLSP